MQCPVCDEKLRTVERYGVEIDICPGCKGIWLDRGELDKILEAEKAGGFAPAVAAPAASVAAPYRSGEHHDHDDDDDHHGERRRDEQGREYRPAGGEQRRKGGWLGELAGRTRRGRGLAAHGAAGTTPHDATRPAPTRGRPQRERRGPAD